MKKIKPIKWVIIILCATLIPLAMIIIITRAILSPPASWWWTFGTLILYVFVGLVTGLIILIVKLRKKKPSEETKVDPSDAEERAKMLLQCDDDNPDNFIREGRMIMRVGERGATRTPVLWLWGRGSETLKKIDIIVNLNCPEKEIEWFFDKDKSFTKEAIRLIAENPAEEETSETILGTDELGRPTTKVITKKMSIAEKKAEEEKKEAEVQNQF